MNLGGSLRLVRSPFSGSLFYRSLFSGPPLAKSPFDQAHVVRREDQSHPVAGLEFEQQT